MKPNWERGTHTKKVLVVYLRERKESCLSLSLSFIIFKMLHNVSPSQVLNPQGYLGMAVFFFFYLFFCNCGATSLEGRKVYVCVRSVFLSDAFFFFPPLKGRRSKMCPVDSRWRWKQFTTGCWVTFKIFHVKIFVPKLSSRVKLLMCVVG